MGALGVGPAAHGYCRASVVGLFPKKGHPEHDGDRKREPIAGKVMLY